MLIREGVILWAYLQIKAVLPQLSVFYMKTTDKNAMFSMIPKIKYGSLRKNQAFTEDSKRLLLYEDYIEVIEGILESRKKSETNRI
ncbi:hypothetical protein [Eisenbergiella sp.]